MVGIDVLFVLNFVGNLDSLASSTQAIAST